MDKMSIPCALIVDQPGNLDVVFGESDGLGQLDSQIEELLTVNLFGYTEAGSLRSRVPLDCALFEGNRRQGRLSPETRRVGLAIAFLSESEP